MTAPDEERPNDSTCICGHVHYGGGAKDWAQDWCGNQCCYTWEQCRKCGRRYSATTGALLPEVSR